MIDNEPLQRLAQGGMVRVIAKKPNHVILHCGTNDLMDSNPEDIAEKIKDLAMKVTKNKINCTVSSLIMRMDRDLSEKILLTNQKLKALLASEKINFRDNT